VQKGKKFCVRKKKVNLKNFFPNFWKINWLKIFPPIEGALQKFPPKTSPPLIFPLKPLGRPSSNKKN